MVQSPKHVATYDHAPQMSAHEITEDAVEALRANVDLVVINFANCDMVGHTGSFVATVRAVETVDACVGALLGTAKVEGYHTFITADHGNAEEMTNADGTPQTAHTTLPVPLYYVGPTARKLRPGILADVAPTLLDAMGLPKPKAMTGASLFLYAWKKGGGRRAEGMEGGRRTEGRRARRPQPLRPPSFRPSPSPPFLRPPPPRRHRAGRHRPPPYVPRPRRRPRYPSSSATRPPRPSSRARATRSP